MCNVVFITGDLKHRVIQYNGIDTSYFTYYYYGSTLEVVEIDAGMRILDIHDITLDDAEYFGLYCNNILTYNIKNSDMLASNDFVYNLKVNNFYNYCKQTVNNIVDRMQQVKEFVLRAYTINGAIIYIELDENPKGNKYTMSPGYIVNNKELLRMNGNITAGMSSSNEKLSQDDIDKIITKMVS